MVYNIHALGGGVYASGVVGRDEMGRNILQQFQALNLDTTGLVVTPKRPTTVKTRVIAHHQQVVRFDREVASPLSSRISRKVVRYLKQRLPNIDAVIISDYGKGIVSHRSCHELISLARREGKPVSQ